MTARHPIRVVAQRTGLSTHLIRMWEKRYGAVKPERTETGRRLYSDDDIERLRLLRRATLAGETISQVANLTVDELARMVAADTGTTNVPPVPGPIDASSARYHLDLCLESVANMDAVNLESRLLQASVALGQQVFLEQVLQPLLLQTGEMWSDGRLKVAHEHLASAVIRSLLGSMFVAARRGQTGPLLLSTTPTGQWHEFGALMASVTSASIGWRTIYLGPNLSAEDIAAAGIQHDAAAVALSIVYPPDDPKLPIEFRKLSSLLPNKTELLIGGRAAQNYQATISEIGASHIGSLTDLRAKLNDLRTNRGSQQAG